MPVKHYFKHKIVSILITALILTLLSSSIMAFSVAPQETEQINIYFFWGDGCPYCEFAKPVLEDMAEQNPQVNLNMFEIYHDADNRDLFFAFGDAYGFEPRGVPTIFVTDKYWVGWSDSIKSEINKTIESCATTSCPDLGRDILSMETEPVVHTPTEEILNPTPTQEILTPAPLQEEIQTETPVAEPITETNPEDPADESGFTLPLIGTIDLSGQSLLVSTLLISFVDGFNPCSIWVLSILLSLTLHTGSRKKVIIVGSVFLFVTAAIYALFIAGIFTVLRIISFIGWVQVVVALIALVFGLINIKDYFWFQKGVSLTISDDKKPGIYKRMRKVLQSSDSIWSLIGATVVLASGIALVEFSCTAGFPVIWSNLLSSQNVETLTFVLLLLVYMLVYLLDEMALFLVAVFTLRSTKFEEKHGRVLKLIGGMLMLTLAVVMLIDPSIMNDITSTLVVFAIALGLSGLVLVVDRVILPLASNSFKSE